MSYISFKADRHASQYRGPGFPHIQQTPFAPKIARANQFNQRNTAQTYAHSPAFVKRAA